MSKTLINSGSITVSNVSPSSSTPIGYINWSDDDYYSIENYPIIIFKFSTIPSTYGECTYIFNIHEGGSSSNNCNIGIRASSTASYQYTSKQVVFLENNNYWNDRNKQSMSANTSEKGLYYVDPVALYEIMFDDRTSERIYRSCIYFKSSYYWDTTGTPSFSGVIQIDLYGIG